MTQHVSCRDFFKMGGSLDAGPDMKTRWLMAPVEINPADAAELWIASGDIVELNNGYGSTYAMAYNTEDANRNHVCMQFGHYNGIQGDVTAEESTAMSFPTTARAPGPTSGWRHPAATSRRYASSRDVSSF